MTMTIATVNVVEMIVIMIALEMVMASCSSCCHSFHFSSCTSPQSAGDIMLRLPETASTVVVVNSETFACDDQLQTQPLEGTTGGRSFLIGEDALHAHA